MTYTGGWAIGSLLWAGNNLTEYPLDSTGSEDYAAMSDTYTLSVTNNGLVTATVPIMDDSESEGTEDFFANLEAANLSPRSTLDPAVATVKIMDEDGTKLEIYTMMYTGDFP